MTQQANLNLSSFDVENIDDLIIAVQAKAKGASASVVVRNNTLFVFYDEDNFSEYTYSVNRIGEFILYRRQCVGSTF